MINKLLTLIKVSVSTINSNSLNVQLRSSYKKLPPVDIYSWISGNLPTLNSSKTEFQIIGLVSNSNFPKIDSSLNTTHSARNLGLIFDEHFYLHLSCLLVFPSVLLFS